MTRWTKAWLIWLVAAGGSFLAIEIPAALQPGSGPFTLSQHVWRWFAFAGGWLVIGAPVAYLAWHFARGAWKSRKGHL